ncbi:MAG TPA: tetratricopeptide repeat protein [Bacteroidales bacterium]|nr:tetratricopeptide repeat protein [Bacteroidales bacterium]
MDKHIKNITAYLEGDLTGNDQKRFEKELQNNEELRNDYYLFKQINESMKARLDLEEVRNDPALNNLVPVVENLINDYCQNQEHYRWNKKFVKDSLSKEKSDSELMEEISLIKKEIKEHKVNELVKTWVNEFNEKEEILKAKNPNTERNREFIARSLEPENLQSELNKCLKKESDKRNYLFRIIGLAAAAVITVFVMFKVLIPSDNPDKLYQAYYEPMRALSPVTRNVKTNLSGKYAETVDLYKKGNYQTAAAGFLDLMQQDSSFTDLRFFAGITQMELGNYSQAIAFLSGVTTLSGEYRIEAQWYLGLSYLKTGDSSKAIACFEVLAGSKGFYQDHARSLLRRLK